MLAALNLTLEHYTTATIRRFVLVALCVVLIATILILNNALNFFHGRAAAYDNQRIKSRWVGDQAKIIEAHRADTESRSQEGKTLVSVITSAAKNYELVVSRYRPDGNGGIQLWISDAPTKAIWLWLDELLATHHLRVSKLSISKSDASGYSDIQLDISASQ